MSSNIYYHMYYVDCNTYMGTTATFTIPNVLFVFSI